MSKDEVTLEEIKLVQEQIFHLLKQLTTNNQIGLTVYFVLIGLAINVITESEFMSGIIFILSFFLLGVFGYLNRRSAKYLKHFYSHLRRLQQSLGMEYYNCLELARVELRSWEDKIFAPRILRYLKWITFLVGYYLVIKSFF